MLNFITHQDDAKKAEKEYNSAKHSYESTVESIKNAAVSLYKKRKIVLDKCVILYNGLLVIKDIPVEFISQIEKALSKQQIDPMSFSEDHSRHSVKANEINTEAWKVMFGGAGVGSGVAMAGSSVLTALATTFGTAGTGAAISSLSGVAATNAILAWIGGGTLAAGGGGMALGSTILGLMGPVGWGIAGISLAGGGWWIRSKNDKAIAEYQKITDEYIHHRDILANKICEVNNLEKEADEDIANLNSYMLYHFPSNFHDFSDKEKLEIKKMVIDIIQSLGHLNRGVE